MAGGKDEPGECGEDDERHDTRLQELEIIACRGLGKSRCAFHANYLVIADDRHVRTLNLLRQKQPRHAGLPAGRSRRNRRLLFVTRHLIRGSCSHWWNGGGEDSCHSSVLAPSPQGLSPATRFFAKASATQKRKISTPTAAM